MSSDQPQSPDSAEPTTSGGDSSARKARVEQMRVAEKRTRRNRLLIAGVVAGVVLAAIVALIVVGVTRDPAPAGKKEVAASGVVTKVTGVPASVFDKVGAGDVAAVPAKLSGDPLTADGKPRVLYIGAEYCPYCAAERWSVVAALSRFGEFSGLSQTTSAAEDVYPSTSTLSFHGSDYTSDWVSFTGVETATNEPDGKGGYTPLETLSAADSKVFAATNPGGGIPYLNVGGKYLALGSSFDPAVLSGKSHEQIAAALADPTSDISRAVLGSANVITAAICESTEQKPAEVCSTPGVKAAAVRLDAQ